MELTDLPANSVPLPWQGQVWAHLAQQMQMGKLPHALMLAGPQGSGKARLALALARFLLCREPVDGLNCGRCHACELSRSGGHGDLRWLQPEDKSRVIKIDQVRAAVEFAGKTAAFGERKVVVLEPADALNVSAANALLKCLEEPAAGTHLILVSHRLHAVPATIRSRCQLLRLPLPAREQSLAWLQPITADEALAARLLELTDGSPLQAEQLYLEGSAERVASVQSGLDALREGRVPVADVAPLLAELPLEQALAEIRQSQMRWLGRAGREHLRSPACRQGFELLDELQRLQAAMDGGSNPNRLLLIDTILTRLSRDCRDGVSIRA